MSGRGGGRDRFRRDYPSRHEDNRGNGISGRDNRNSNRNSNRNNPPSRHLWVGNLSHNIVEEELAHHFLRYGPLENVAFQPGRSYAFINFRMDEDAIDALRALQGFPLAGNPLRIEFAKAVSVAHLLLLVTFPADYMNLLQKFNSVQFYLFNQGHSIGLEINLQNLHKEKKK
ncbi:Flowering time control protein FPA [Glycine soja]|uniref:Flowering time control protein FPA n=1 Tax=Glycine soja TaxID=3848 RepID=A0A0B2NU09_GLYSO|nr:Flowering time control protein FPA [Glycine soja]